MNKQSLVLTLASLAIVGSSLMAIAANTKTTPTQTTSKSTMKIAPVNVNTATLKQLETLPGIGPKIAADIIKYRPYKSSKDLEAKVKGIGSKTWTEIAPYVKFK